MNMTKLIRRLKTSRFGAFCLRLTEGMAMQELWRQLRTEARFTYGIYSKDTSREPVEDRPSRARPFRVGRALLWAAILKLSPPRRVLLLIALGLLVVSVPSPFGLLAAASLLLLLGLELADRVAMKRDLEIAREIQRWLVPDVPPQLEGLDIAFATRPADTVSGDYYDVFRRAANSGGVTGGHLLLVVADVAGKGVPAALLMATFQASLRTLAATPASLVDLVSGLNRFGCAHSHGGLRFTTAFIAELDRTTSTLSYVDAGHNPPILRRVSGKIERLEKGGLPLGISAAAHYDCGAVMVNPGDILVVPTDGVIEAENEKQEQYGDPRLLDVVAAPPKDNATAILTRLLASLDAFVGRARQHDDITCLIVRFL